MQAHSLDAIFGALSDPTRRLFLKRLAQGPRTVGELAEGVSISAPAVSRHVKVLERAGLLVREKRGRTHVCSLGRGALDTAEAFVRDTRAFWEGNLDALADYLEGEP